MTESIVLRCRSCKKKNRLNPQKALADLARAICGSCRAQLLVPLSEPLTNVKTAHFEHPLDQAALRGLKQIPGVERITRMIIKESFERSEILRHYASYVRVGEKQLPHIHRLYLRAATRLEIDPLPDLFVVQSPIANAYTIGAEKTIVAINSGLIELLDEDELVGVLAHELTHVKCDHVLFKTAARFITFAGTSLAASTVGLSNILFIPLRLALLEWDRCSELTADRGELLVTGSVDCHLRTMMKLAGGSTRIYEQMNVEAFLEQIEALESMQDASWVNKLTGAMQSLERSHPFPVWRAKHTREWAHTPGFFQLMANDPISSRIKAKPKKGSSDDSGFVDRAKRILNGD